MENFFEWITRHIPKDDVSVWFDMNDIKYEKIQLYGDIFKSLYFIINDTYLGDDNSETRIVMSDEDKLSHFEWCWSKLISNFKEEKIEINKEGDHKKYFKNFFKDAYYNSESINLKEGIDKFLYEIFNIEKPFTKSDLDILTELYKLLDDNVKLS